MWWKRAKPGDKVVCVDDDWNPHSSLPQNGYPAKGTVHTVKGVYPAKHYPGRTGFGLVISGYRCWFCPTCFRPIQKKSTEHQVNKLKSLLNGTPIKEDV